MYLEGNIGGVLNKIRIEKHITQETLSDGVCSPSTISRIENGCQEPTGPMFRRILERLGEPGFYSGYYHDRNNLKCLDLKRKLLECFELQDMSAFDDIFDKFLQAADFEDVHILQFLRLMEAIYYEISKGEPLGSSSDLYADILRMTFKNYQIGDDLQGKLFDHTEFLILNNLALSLFSEGKIDEATHIIRHLIHNLGGNKHFHPLTSKVQAGLYNNLSLIFMNTEKHARAIDIVCKAITMSSLEGGMLFILKLIRTRWKIYQSLGYETEANKDLIFIYRGMGILSPMVKSCNSIKEFLKRPTVMRVF